MKKIVEAVKFYAEFAVGYVLIAGIAACGISATAALCQVLTETMPK